MKFKMNGLKKRFVTLVEMMIVMFLIAMIMGVIAVNYSGSLDEGKAFKTKTGIEKIHTVLDLYAASHPDEAGSIDSNWRAIVQGSPLVKNGSESTKDGWGIDYVVNIGDNGEIQISSVKYNEYQENKGKGGLFNSKK